MRLFLLTAFIGLLGFASCSDDLSTDGPNTGGTTPNGDTQLRVSIKLPGTDAVPYSQIATDPELKIDTVIAYVFAQEGSEFVYNSYSEFSAQKGNSGDIILAGDELTLLVDIQNREKDIKLYFVANGVGTTSLENLIPQVSKESDFLKALTNVSLQGKSNLMMTTDSIRVTSDELKVDNPSITLTGDRGFTRVVSRIDIRNSEKTLAIDKVQFLNVPRQSLVFNRKDAVNGWVFADSAAGRTNFSQVTIVDSLRFPPKTEGTATANMDSVHLPSLFYPYEGRIEDPNNKNDGSYNTTVRIWGRLNPTPGDMTSGSSVVYTLNLAEGKDHDNQSKSQLLRNTRYILQINNALAEELNYTFNVVDWTHEDTDTVPAIMDPAITIKYNNNYFTQLNGGLSPATEYKINVTSSTEWDVSVKYIDDASSNWLTTSGRMVSYADTIGDYFTIKADTSLLDEERVAIVTVKSTVPNVNRSTQFRFIQRANVPLIKWAKANLEKNFTIGADLDTTTARLESSYGGLFQFGRNVGFTFFQGTAADAPSGEDTTSIKVPVANAVADNKFILAPTAPYAWYAEEGALEDTWYNIVGTATPEAKDKLTNDPCTATGSEYRLPTANDVLKIAPYNSNAGRYLISNEAKTAKINEAVEYSGNQVIVETGPAFYLEGEETGAGIYKVRTLYGIKKMGTTNAYALRWSYVGSGTNVSTAGTGDTYLKIEAIPVAATVTHENTNTIDAFKALDWESAVVRYFPVTGSRNRTSGAPSMRGVYGWYWTSTASNRGDGWSFNIRPEYLSLISTGQAQGLPIRCVKQ